MKLILVFLLSASIFYFHLTLGLDENSSTKTKKNKPIKLSADGKVKPNPKPKENRPKVNKRSIDDERNQQEFSPKNKNSAVRTPFDKVLDKLSKCSEKSPDLIEVMQKNLEELRTDRKFENFFQSAGHTAAFIAREKIDDNEFFGQLRQSILADWSNPKWKSAKQIESLFQPLKQQFVYAMMRFKCD